VTNDEWEKETRRRFNLIEKYFKLKEILVIYDFITTGRDVSKEENVAKQEVTSDF